MNNPSAFPRPYSDNSDGDDGTDHNFAQTGMTLLDYFAGQVLAGICSDTAYLGRPNDIAGYAYSIAATMLKAREVALRELGGADGAG